MLRLVRLQCWVLLWREWYLITKLACKRRCPGSLGRLQILREAAGQVLTLTRHTIQNGSRTRKRYDCAPLGGSRSSRRMRSLPEGQGTGAMHVESHTTHLEDLAVIGQQHPKKCASATHNGMFTFVELCSMPAVPRDARAETLPIGRR